MNTLAVSQLTPRGIQGRLRAHPTALGAALTVLAICLVLGFQIVDVGFDLGGWDWLFVSGSVTALAGLWLARGQPERCAEMVKQLKNRGTLVPAGAALDAAMKRLENQTNRWARGAAVSLGALIAAGFIWVYVASDIDRPIAAYIGGPIAGLVGGILVGRVLGRMASYGRLVRFLEHSGIALTAKPRHADGAAGLKPLGDFYFRQALLLAIPAAFLLAWWILFFLPPWDARYGEWRGWYAALFGVVAYLQVAAFVAPLVRVHKVMKRCKRDLLLDADGRLADTISRLRDELAGDLDKDAREAKREHLADLVARYEEVERMPTWPVDRSLRRRLTLGYAELVVGLVAQVATLAGFSS